MQCTPVVVLVHVPPFLHVAAVHCSIATTDIFQILLMCVGTTVVYVANNIGCMSHFTNQYALFINIATIYHRQSCEDYFCSL